MDELEQEFQAWEKLSGEAFASFEKGLDRFLCTKEHPWTKDKGRAQHPDAKHDGTCTNECCDYYKCPHCGLRFRVELPE